MKLRGRLAVLLLVAGGVGLALAGRPGPGLAMLLLAVALLLALVRARGAGTAAPPPPVPLPPEEIELEEGPIYACLRCGSPEVRYPRLSEGMIPGAGDMMSTICGRCHARGPAVRFDDATAYRQFVKGLRADAEAASAGSGQGPEDRVS